MFNDKKATAADLAAVLAQHEAAEEAVLVQYRQVASAARDSGVRFLMQLICEDEERHHRLLATMQADAERAAKTTGQIGPTVEGAVLLQDQALDRTDAFLAHERDGLRQLNRLRRMTKRLSGGPSNFILDLMAADTRRHIAILEYINSRLRAALGDERQAVMLNAEFSNQGDRGARSWM